jgi:hypothetical protein
MASNIDALSPTERKEFRTLIGNREAGLLAALEEQFNTTTDSLMQVLRISYGLQYTSIQLKDLLKSTEEQITLTVSKHIQTEKTRIETQVQEVTDDFEQKEREMKERHRREYEALRQEKEDQLSVFKAQRQKLEATLAMQYARDLVEKREEYKRQLADTTEKEIQIGQEADIQHTLMVTNKARIRQLLQDRANRAREALVMIDTRTEAKTLLTDIPTVEEAMDILRGKDGVRSLLEKVGVKSDFLAVRDSTPRLSGTVAQVDNDDATEPANVRVNTVNSRGGGFIDSTLVEQEGTGGVSTTTTA